MQAKFKFLINRKVPCITGIFISIANCYTTFFCSFLQQKKKHDVPAACKAMVHLKG
jgi:hypothetical protein